MWNVASRARESRYYTVSDCELGARVGASVILPEKNGWTAGGSAPLRSAGVGDMGVWHLGTSGP